MSDERAVPLAACAADAPPKGLPVSSADALQGVVSELQRELIACQRLAMLGSMSAMIVHEFNNLLTPILARAEVAIADPGDAAFLRLTLERVLTQARRAQDVARRLLDLAHDAPRPTTSCALAPIVSEAVAALTRPPEKDGIELRLDVPEDVFVYACPDLLRQVLLNLLLNARKAMQGRSGRLGISAKADTNTVQIDVSDSGVGLPVDILEQKINPFLAANPYEHPHDWQQVGLGLSVCRLIVHHHGASLRALNNPDGGCTFRLVWPRASAFRPEPASSG